MIDIHSHILWCMDDGPESMEESLAMASIAAKEGISTIVATPHCIDEKDLTGFAQRVEEKCQQLNKALDREGIPLKVIPGAEVYMDLDILEWTGLDELTLGNTNYILVEMPMGEVPRYAENFLYHLQLKGLTPIIAHPERNRVIMEDPNLLKRFIELGSLAQINTGSITGLFGSKVQESARILLTHNMGHVLGTDAHSRGKRGPYMREAIELTHKWLGEDRAEEIIMTNPRKILQGETLEVDPPKEYRRKKRFFGLFGQRR